MQHYRNSGNYSGYLSYQGQSSTLQMLQRIYTYMQLYALLQANENVTDYALLH